MPKKHTIHAPHSQPQSPHIDDQAFHDQMLATLQLADVELEEVVQTLRKSTVLSAVVLREAETHARASRIGLEVKSLKHAVALIGLNRLQSLFNQQFVLDESFQRSA